MATRRARRSSSSKAAQKDGRRRDRGRDEQQVVEGPRSFWSGSISFGLVNVPIRLLSATRPQRVARRRLGPDDQPLAREYYCPEDGTALDGDSIVRGYELPSGEMVPLEDDELEAIEPDKSREIALSRFVARSEVPAQFFERAYFLVPGDEASRAYHLLVRAMEQGDRVGIATFVMRGKEHLVAILASKGVLRAELLRFAGELRSLDDVGIAPDAGAKPDAKLVRELRGEVSALWRDELPTEELENRGQQRLRELVEEKSARGEDVVAAADPDATDRARDNVVDLMSYLERSLEATARDGGGQGNGNAARTTRKAKHRPARRATELEGLKKSELYERAQAEDIEGRSSMTKAQLIEALQQQGA